jgi:hypothetical protein
MSSDGAEVRRASSDLLGGARPLVSFEPPPSGAFDPLDEEIHLQIEQAVRHCGNSGSELARRIGVKPSTVSQWRSGIKRPDVRHFLQVQKLARRLPIISEATPMHFERTSHGS